MRAILYIHMCVCVRHKSKSETSKIEASEMEINIHAYIFIGKNLSMYARACTRTYVCVNEYVYVHLRQQQI